MTLELWQFVALIGTMVTGAAGNFAYLKAIVSTMRERLIKAEENIEKLEEELKDEVLKNQKNYGDIANTLGILVNDIKWMKRQMNGGKNDDDSV